MAEATASGATALFVTPCDVLWLTLSLTRQREHPDRAVVPHLPETILHR